MEDDETTDAVARAAGVAVDAVHTLAVDLGDDRLQVAFDDVLDLITTRLIRLSGASA